MGGGDTVCRLYGTPCPANGQRVRMNRLRRGGGQMGTLSRFCDLVPELPEFYAPPLPPSNSLFLPVHVSAISGYISYLLLPPPPLSREILTLLRKFHRFFLLFFLSLSFFFSTASFVPRMRLTIHQKGFQNISRIQRIEESKWRIFVEGF